MPSRLRVFISSPGDVPDERLRADLVIDKLAQEYSRFFTIGSYRWEHEPMLASGHFQDAVEPPSKFDIVIMILWSRLGTPLPEHTAARDYKGIDGRTPITGTEWEYEEALKAARELGAPDILAFRNVSPAAIDPRDQEARARSNAQLDALDAFWKRHFADREMFLAAYDEYRTLEDFARRLEESLRKLIERRIKAGKGSDAPIWVGAPFRGLAAYEFEHAAIFFGRDSAIAKAAEQLATQARSGSAFLLVCGPSGSGKSSLVKAALVPRLMKPQRITGKAFIRRVVFRPGDNGEDIIRGLAEALTRSQIEHGVGLPELLGPGQDATRLAAHLRASVEEPGFIFAGTLGCLTEAGRSQRRLLGYEEAKLILVIDQLEELFTVPGVSTHDRQLFIQLLAGLARSGSVWVVATLRSDFWHRVANIPEMVVLAQGLGRFDIAAPSPSDLAEVISKPAQAAGLSFEISNQTGRGLDAILADQAATEPNVLPLLSFTLDELYRRDVTEKQGSVLTFATYETLGTLEGAIATRADEIFGALPETAQAALPPVLRALATISTGTEAVAVARSAPIESFSSGTDARTLVDALTDARLLVASTEGSVPTLRLAHEALISRWKRARDQLLSDRRDLETRELVERQQRRWQNAGGSAKRQLLLRDPDLANAVDLSRRWGDELDPQTRGFIQASWRRARMQQQLTVVAALCFALLAVAGTVAAVLAFEARGVAKQQRNRALATQSRLLAERASRLTQEGDTLSAILLSLEALRSPDDQGPEPYDPAVEKSLADALYRHPLQFVLRENVSPYVDAAFAHDGSILATVAENGNVSFWTADEDGRLLPRTQMAASVFGAVVGVMQNPKQPIFLVFRKDGSYIAWNYRTNKAVPGVEGSCNQNSRSFQFDLTGERLLVYCQDIRIFDLATDHSINISGPFEKFAVAGNGKRFVTRNSDLIEVWDGATGNLITSWTDTETRGLAINHNGEMVLTYNYETIRFWNSTTGTVARPPLRASQARTFDVYTSPFDDFFVTESDDGTKVFSSRGDSPIQQLPYGTTFQTFLQSGLLAFTEKVEAQKITLYEYITEGHTGTQSAVDRVTLYVGEGHQIAAYTFDGSRVVTAAKNGDLYIWTTEPPMLLRAIADTGERLGNPAGVSRDGKIAATVSTKWDGDKSVGVTLWNADTLTEKQRVNVENGIQISDLRLSKDARRFLYIAERQGSQLKGPWTYAVYDAAEGKKLLPIADQDAETIAGDISPNGELAATVSGNQLFVWRMADGSRVQQCQLDDTILALIFTDTDANIAVATDDGKVTLVAWQSCAARQILYLSTERNKSIALTYKDGLVIAMRSSLVQIWSERDERQIADREVVDWTVWDVLPTASRIVTAKESKHFIPVIDVATGNELLRFRADVNDCCFPSDLAVLPGGKELLTQWSERGAYRLRIWRLLPTLDAARDVAIKIVPQCLSSTDRKKFGLDPEPPRWCIDMAKPPYNAPQWKQWLVDKDAGKEAILPSSQ
jgi:WD40 repeat protein/energy-coupling factor transporter ATP-binding protein EcfA2